MSGSGKVVKIGPKILSHMHPAVWVLLRCLPHGLPTVSLTVSLAVSLSPALSRSTPKN